MESVRIYVPENRVREPVVQQAIVRVTAGGATLYHATGFWSGGEEVVSERIIVVEVLDWDQGRQEAVEGLVATLLAAGEEAVLVAKQHTVIHFSVRGSHPVQAGPVSLIN